MPYLTICTYIKCESSHGSTTSEEDPGIRANQLTQLISFRDPPARRVEKIEGLDSHNVLSPKAEKEEEGG